MPPISSSGSDIHLSIREGSMGTNGSMRGQHVGQAVIGCCLGGWGGRGGRQLHRVRLRLELARLGRELGLDVKVVDHPRGLSLALGAVEEEP